MPSDFSPHQNYILWSSTLRYGRYVTWHVVMAPWYVCVKEKWSICGYTNFQIFVFMDIDSYLIPNDCSVNGFANGI